MGRLLSHKFAKLGCELILWDVNKEGNEQTATQVKRLGAKVQAYVVDLSNREDVYKVAEMVCVHLDRPFSQIFLPCMMFDGGSNCQ